MEWPKFVEWAFQAILAGSAIYGAQSLKGLRESIDELNKQMAVILERDTWHTKWLEKHDSEIKDIKEQI
jgi:hypothetical protein